MKNGAIVNYIRKVAMNKRVRLIERILLVALLVTFVSERVRRCIFSKRVRAAYEQTKENAYFSEVTFWGDDSFYTKEVPVEKNGLIDVPVYLNKPVVYTTEMYSTNRQSRIVFEVRPVDTGSLKYELSIVVYNFHSPYGRGGKSIPYPMQFFISSTGIRSPGYKGLNATSSVSFEGVDVYASIPPEQKEGTCEGYVYINFPNTSFSNEDGVAFCDSPATFPRDKLHGKLLRLTWNYESEVVVP